MKRTWVLILIGLFISTSGYAATAKAVIKGTQELSSVSGQATLKDLPEGLEVKIEVSGVTPGMHGIHIHEKGSCDEAGNAAGGHYNPEGVKHGYILKDGLSGSHVGDMGNIEVGADGKGSLTMVIPGLTVNNGKYNALGRSVILHEKQDDFGQPTGNAGSRVGCGVIEEVPAS